MAKELMNTIGTMEFDNLLIARSPVADVVTVTLAASQGVLPRGAVITGTAGGEMSQAKAALVATNATYILADETDTGSAAVVATAYRTGHFNKQALAFGGEYTIADADVEILRNAGILLSDAIDVNMAESE